MVDRSRIDYSHLDRPEILLFLFHPRGEYRRVEEPPNAADVLIPVEENVVIGGRFHVAQQGAPNLLSSTETGKSWQIMTRWLPSTTAWGSTSWPWTIAVRPVHRKSNDHGHDEGLP